MTVFRTEAQTETPGGSFLDPRVLARIDNLELLARTVVDGFINGLHRSPYVGLSVDFAEHRAYMPGDDIRWIDWRLYARTDRHFVKQFEADTNANFVLLLDTSGSMDFGTRGVSKLDYARFLASSLAYFSSKQRDRVGLVTFDHEVIDYVPPAVKHLNVVLNTIARLQPGGASALGPPLVKVTEALKRRGVLVLVSDLYEEPESVLNAVKNLRYRGHDVIVFHLLDRAELDFSFDKAAPFEDLETGERLPVVPDHLREQYRSLVQAHTAELSRRFSDNRIDYVLINTSTPLDHALFRYLSERQRLSRTR